MKVHSYLVKTTYGHSTPKSWKSKPLQHPARPLSYPLASSHPALFTLLSPSGLLRLHSQVSACLSPWVSAKIASSDTTLPEWQLLSSDVPLSLPGFAFILHCFPHLTLPGPLSLLLFSYCLFLLLDQVLDEIRHVIRSIHHFIAPGIPAVSIQQTGIE
jgi:hypothetical protein